MQPFYPKPRKLKLGKRSIDLSKRTRILIDPGVSSNIRRKTLAICQSHQPGAILTGTLPPAADVLLHVLPLDRKIRKEGYGLVCSQSGITIKAGDEHGVFHGLQTLSQLLAQTGLTVPELTVEDYPDFAHRAVMLDVSRCKIPTMSTMYQLVDALAKLKINQLQLYIEHAFAFSNHQQVWQASSPFTAQEIMDLDAYCLQNFVELVPNLNSFGHFERWLKHPEYHKYAECPSGFEHPLGGHRPVGSTLKPNKSSLNLLSELYQEYLPNFSSTKFNIGADEPWELGQGWSQKNCRAQGKTAVYLDFLRKIKKLANRHSEEVQFWGDIILSDSSELSRLPADLTALIWGYEAEHPFKQQTRTMAEHGIPFYVCPGTSSWNSLTGRSQNAKLNLANAAKSGLAADATGYLITDWGDGGHHQYLPISYPGLLMGACYAWCFRSNRDIDPAKGVDQTFFDHQNVGHILWDLGKVPDLVPAKIRNATIFNQLLFWDMDHEPEYMKGIDATGLTACLAELSGLEEQARTIGHYVRDGDLVKAEVCNSIRMAKHGISRYLLYRGESRNQSAVRIQLEEIIATHDELWLQRNRIGGLYESSSRLRDSLAPLQR